MNKKLELRVTKAVDRLLDLSETLYKISNELSDLQDTYNNLMLEAYDDGFDEGEVEGKAQSH